jgi:hypothetical protein
MEPSFMLPKVSRCGVAWRLIVHDPEKWEPVFGKDHARVERAEGELNRTTIND